MDGSILGGGTFTVGASVVPVTLNIPGGVDWMRVQNYTQTGLPGDAEPNGINFWWQRGMPVGGGIVYYKHNVADNHLAGVDIFLDGGFTLYNDNAQLYQPQGQLSEARATTASTNAAAIVVSTADTSGVAVGTVIRLSNTAQTDVNGVDMLVTAVTTDTSMTLVQLDNAPGVVGGAGFYRIVNYTPLYYPPARVIATISPNNALGVTSVQFTAPVGYVAGQKIRFNIPAICGSQELNPTADNNYATFTITAVSGSVVDAFVNVINIDTTGYNISPFSYPTVAQMPSSLPMATPVGEDTAAALVSLEPQTPKYYTQQIFSTNTGILSDSTVNTSFSGMILGVGGNVQDLADVVSGPAGNTAGDFVIWISGKCSFYNIF